MAPRIFLAAPGAPSITSVSSTNADGRYKAGSTITLTLRFDQLVDVTGTPTLELNASTGRFATYDSGSGTDTLRFTYTVAAGDNSSDLDYVGASSLALNGGTVTLAGDPSINAVLTLFTPGTAGSLGANNNIVIDGVAPTVTITTDRTTLGIDDVATITFTFSEDPVGTFTWNGSAGDVTVTGGTVTAISGSALIRTATFTPTPGINAGSASISVAAASYVDAAGNYGSAGSEQTISYDTLRPEAPVTPRLDPASDTGVLGDGRTTDTRPMIKGGAEADATIVLYDGAVEIGRATADSGGNWGVVVPLSVGSHSLKATQQDAAGNVSVASAAFALSVESPPAPPSPPDNPGTLVDGVLVQTGTMVLPGGIAGSTVSIPVVGAGRAETGGAPNVADISLASAGTASLLMAQLPVGYGLTASGANVSRAVGLDLLNATIKAAMPTQGASEQAQLLATGQSFLSQQPGDSPVLITTIAPVSTAPSATVPLTLSSAGAPDAQRVALVIDTTGLAAASKLDLVDVDFAAVIGKANVSVRGGGTVISGDAAAQHITVAAGRGDTVFAGAGNDVLSVDLSSSVTAARATTVLHGGQGNDLVRFSGGRDDYVVDQHQGYVIVTSKADPALRTQVINAEQLQFGDAVVDVGNASGMTTLAGIYQAVLGRQADVNGIDFWATGRAAGASWGTIAVNFINAGERLATQSGFNGNAQHDVTLLFNALFGRTPDAEGLAFWTKALGNGASLEQVATGFVESVEMIGHQVAATDWNFRV